MLALPFLWRLAKLNRSDFRIASAVSTPLQTQPPSVENIGVEPMTFWVQIRRSKPAELIPQINHKAFTTVSYGIFPVKESLYDLAVPTGFEPVPHAVTRRHCKPFNHGTKKLGSNVWLAHWSVVNQPFEYTRWDSNPREHYCSEIESLLA